MISFTISYFLLKKFHSRNKKSIKSRKGELTAFAVIIIFAIVVVVMIFLIKTYLDSVNPQMDIKSCQESLLLTKAVAGVTSSACFFGTIDLFSLDCSRKFIDIEKGKVLMDSKDITKQYTPICPDGSKDCLEKNVMAQEMAYCWKEFFEGEQNVLQQIDISSSSILTTKDRKNGCFICAQISTDQDVDGFYDYLKNKKMPKSEATYYDYLAKNPKAWCETDFAKQSNTETEQGTCWDSVNQGVQTTLLKAGDKATAKNCGNTKDNYDDCKTNIVTTAKQTGNNDVGTNILSKDTHIAIDPNKLPPQKYVVTFIRRGLGSCEGTDNKDKIIGDAHLTNTVQIIPANQFNEVCDLVLV